VEELRKITDITSQNSWFNLNPGVLIIQLQYLVFDDLRQGLVVTLCTICGFHSIVHED